MSFTELLVHMALWLHVWILLTDISIHMDLGMFFFTYFMLLEGIC
jgi:hypothetical protein